MASDEQRRRLEEALPIPWEKNPLVVFGFSLETVEAIRHRPEVLGKMARLMKKPLMLAHHADHTGIEASAEALNDAQAYLENPYWQRTIIRQYLEQMGSADRQQKRQIEQLREKLSAVTAELMRMQQRGLVKEPEAVERDPVEALTPWFLNHLVYSEQAAREKSVRSFFPNLLPAYVVAAYESGGGEVLWIGPGRKARSLDVTKKHSAKPINGEDVLRHHLHYMYEKPISSQVSVEARTRELGAETAIAYLQALSDELAGATQLPSRVIAIRDRRYWPQATLPDAQRDGEAFGVYEVKLRLSKALYVSRGQKAKSLADVRQSVGTLLAQYQSTLEDQQRILADPLRWVLGTEDRAYRYLLDHEDRREAAAYPVVLGSLRPDDLPSRPALDELYRTGTTLPGGLVAVMPKLSPTLEVGNYLVAGWQVAKYKDEAPMVRVRVPGKLVTVLPLRDAVVRTQMQLMKP